MRIIYILMIVFYFSGCTTHKSPLQSNGKYIFVSSDEKEIFQAAYEAMLEGSRESPIADISGPVRGYSFTRRSGLDYWTSMIRVFPATGVTENGESVRGYYPEVSGGGTLILRGPPMDNKIYKAAIEKFGEVGRRIDVISIERGEYRFERDVFRLNEKASLRDGGAIRIEGLEESPSRKSIEERLNELDGLVSKKIITDIEYEKARARILEDL
jgi:hypothetical protein